MTEQTTTETTVYPTPALDALRAATPAYEAERAGFILAEANRLRGLSREEVLAEARTQMDGIKSNESKKTLIPETAEALWMDTEAFRAHEALKTTSNNEARVLKAIAGEDSEVEFYREKARKALEAVRPNVEDVMEAAANLRSAQISAGMWQRVGYVIKEYGYAPLEAVKVMLADAIKDSLGGHENRSLSRSTGVLRNLVTDIDVEARAAWIREAGRVVNGTIEVEGRNLGW